jgi:D-glycero-D-manno-heptose 1,7-bisphosphate phosphatase
LRPDKAVSLHGRPALFLDRDGVLVEETGYLHRAEEVRLIPGATAAVAAAARAGLPVVLITNQAGIGRGYYGWAEFQAVQEKIAADLAVGGGAFDMVLACPFHAAGQPPYRHPDHPCRKPRPGMILRAAEMLGLDLAGSWVVGDRAIDLEAGRAAGLAGGVHVLTGHGAAERGAALELATGKFRTLGAESIAEVPALLPLFAPS